MVISIFLCFLPIIAGILGLKACGIRLSHTFLAVLAALVIILPISLVQYFTGSISIPGLLPVLNVLLKSFLVYGLIEESLKTLTIALFPNALKGKIVYTEKQCALLAFFFGLVLGCFESEIYFLSHLMQANSWGASLMYRPILFRMITTDLIHGLCAAISGIYIWKWHNNDQKTLFILVPVILHTFYDFFVGFQTNLKFFSIIVVLYALAKCFSLFEKQDKNSD